MGFKMIDLDTEAGRKKYEKLQKTKSIKKAFEDEQFIENLAPREEAKTETDTQKKPKISKKGVVFGVQQLRVRKSPNGEVLYLISEKSIVDILQDDGEWVKVETAPNRIGYVMKEYIKEYTEGG